MQMEIMRTSTWFNEKPIKKCKAVKVTRTRFDGKKETEKRYVTDIEQLSDLLGIIDTEGSIVLTKIDGVYRIEIYDDYRE